MMAQNRHWEQNKDATVYIGNIDERANDALIYELMTQVGPVANIHLPKDRVTQSHQGFGFVEFNSEPDADYASKVMNGVRLYNKPLRINMASADKQKAHDIGAELFVGNLDALVDEKTLYDTFSSFGDLATAPKIARDETGQSKGYGFVSYTDFGGSDDAVANMNKQYVMSKEISVQYAYKKDGKGERHGDEAERKLAAQAKKHNIVRGPPLTNGAGGGEGRGTGANASAPGLGAPPTGPAAMAPNGPGPVGPGGHHNRGPNNHHPPAMPSHPRQHHHHNPQDGQQQHQHHQQGSMMPGFNPPPNGPTVGPPPTGFAPPGPAGGPHQHHHHGGIPPPTGPAGVPPQQHQQQQQQQQQQQRLPPAGPSRSAPLAPPPSGLPPRPPPSTGGYNGPAGFSGSGGAPGAPGTTAPLAGGAPGPPTGSAAPGPGGAGLPVPPPPAGFGAPGGGPPGAGAPPGAPPPGFMGPPPGFPQQQAPGYGRR